MLTHLGVMGFNCNSDFEIDWYVFNFINKGLRDGGLADTAARDKAAKCSNLFLYISIHTIQSIYLSTV